ncbi:hypothetical protein ATE59_10415 [Sphingopyxis sp. A083]|nr:hypothetical protein ATE59_10415 [Sphingopyxis sp. A083]
MESWPALPLQASLTRRKAGSDAHLLPINMHRFLLAGTIAAIAFVPPAADSRTAGASGSQRTAPCDKAIATLASAAADAVRSDRSGRTNIGCQETAFETGQRLAAEANRGNHRQRCRWYKQMLKSASISI